MEANATSLEFNVDGILPSAVPGIVFYNNTGQLESNMYSVSGGLLHQQTFSVNGNASYFWPDVDLLTGYTIYGGIARKFFVFLLKD